MWVEIIIPMYIFSGMLQDLTAFKQLESSRNSISIHIIFFEKKSILLT